MPHDPVSGEQVNVPSFGAFGAAWDDAMVARWSANPLGMLWPEMDAAFGRRVARTVVRRQQRAVRWWSLPGVSARVGSRLSLVSALPNQPFQHRLELSQSVGFADILTP